MGNPKEQDNSSTRRTFAVYHLSPFIFSIGMYNTACGTGKNIIARHGAKTEQEWTRNGGLDAEIVTGMGLGLTAIGVGVKAIDVFLQRREAGKKEKEPVQQSPNST